MPDGIDVALTEVTTPTAADNETSLKTLEWKAILKQDE